MNKPQYESVLVAVLVELDEDGEMTDIVQDWLGWFPAHRSDAVVAFAKGQTAVAVLKAPAVVVEDCAFLLHSVDVPEIVFDGGCYAFEVPDLPEPSHGPLPRLDMQNPQAITRKRALAKLTADEKRALGLVDS